MLSVPEQQMPLWRGRRRVKKARRLTMMFAVLGSVTMTAALAAAFMIGDPAYAVRDPGLVVEASDPIVRDPIAAIPAGLSN